MKDIKAISIDWEGTVVYSPKDEKPWPLDCISKLSILLQAIFKEEGIFSFINTGRQTPFVEAIFASKIIVPIKGCPSITENGSCLFYPITNTFKLNPLITEGKLKRFLFERVGLERLVQQLGGKMELGKNFMFSARPPENIKVVDFYSEIKKEIQALIDDKIVEITYSSSAVDVTIYGVNKITGINFWCDIMGIGKQHLSAIGDSAGDNSVLQEVTFPMAPANAADDTKAIVSQKGYISPYPICVGVIDAIGKIVHTAGLQKMCQDFIKEA